MTTTELRLKHAIGFRGTSVKSLIKAAKEKHGLVGNNPKQLLEDCIKKEKARRKALETKNAKNFKLSRKKYNELQLKANLILASFRSGYSMGDNKKLFLKGYKEPFLHVDCTSEYPPSCWWKAVHGSLSIQLTKKDLERIVMIGGLWTIGLGNHRARWIFMEGSKGSAELVWIEGWLVGETHSSVGLEECMALERRKNQARISELIDKKNRQEQILNDISLQKFVGVDHLTELGACPHGIGAFCSRHNLNQEYGYSLAYLISLGDLAGSKYFTQLKRILCQ